MPRWAGVEELLKSTGRTQTGTPRPSGWAPMLACGIKGLGLGAGGTFCQTNTEGTTVQDKDLKQQAKGDFNVHLATSCGNACLCRQNVTGSGQKTVGVLRAVVEAGRI